MSSDSPATSSSSSSGRSTPPTSAIDTQPASPKLSDSTSESSLEEQYALPASMRLKEVYSSIQHPSLPKEYPPLPKVEVLSGPLDAGTPDEWIKRDSRLIRLVSCSPSRTSVAQRSDSEVS